MFLRRPSSKKRLSLLRRQGGFALVISLSLMAFTRLLLLAVSALVRVESQSSEISLRQMSARCNALLALNIALGELQKHAGPDARGTARAMMLDSDPATEAVEGVSNPYWTGVWRVDPGTGVRELLTWLVSGNASLSPADGEFIAAESTVLNDTNSVTILGEGAYGASAANPADLSVRAKVLNIDDGRYAYWVSGEQQKAKMNMVDNSVVDPIVDDAFPRTLARQYQFAHLDNFGASMLPSGVNRALEFDQAIIALGLKEIEADSFKQYYHDVTIHSEGLLTNASSGGLKVDLSALLSGDMLPDDYQGVAIYEAPADILADALATQSPTWDYLKSYYDLKEDVLADGKLTPRPGKSDVPGISPVIAMFGFGFSGGLSDGSSNPADDNRLFINLFPKLVLYNPYSVTLKGQRYGLVLWGNQVAGGELSGGVSKYFPVFQGLVNGTDSKTYETGLAFVHGGATGGGDANVRTNKEDPGLPPSQYAAFPPNFIVECPDIPPGQAVVLMPASRANYDRFGDHDNILTDNSDELPFRWYTRIWLTNQTDPVTPYVIWKQFNASPTNKLYLDAALLEPDFLYNDSMWSDPDNTYSQRYLNRSTENDFYDHVYQLTGRIPIRVSEYSSANTQTSYFNAPDMYASELISWAAYGFLAQSDGHGEMIRPYVNFNLRAKDMDAANIANNEGDYAHSFYEAYGINPGAEPTLDYFDNGKKIYFGGGYTPLSGGVESFILFDVPDDEVGLYSLGQLQHLKVSDHFDETGYAIGNSWASPFIARDAVYRHGAGDEQGLTGYLGNVDYSNVDVSYLLNKALWDQYFFSTITNMGLEGDTDFHIPVNPVIRIFDQEGTDLTFEDPLTNAQYLYVKGAFNVNSTSVVAWEAVLSALNGIVLPDIGVNALAYPFFRFLDPAYGSDEPWAGFRELTATEIHGLAVAIVEQVKRRGPFLSLADFVNRELVDEASDTNNLGLKGALQTAIDQTAINDTALGEAVTEGNIMDFPVASHAVGGTADGIAGYLSQADILTALSPIVTVRSDTFLIRCYGDATNSLTGKVEGRAWCEAVVQRIPEYVDAASDAPDVQPDGLGEVNRVFGRRYEIVALRWLNPDDI